MSNKTNRFLRKMKTNWLYSETENSNFELLWKTGRIYDVKTVEARAAQKLHKSLSNEIAELEKEIK